MTCYTCHNGKPVPEYIWFTDDSETRRQRLMPATATGQNTAEGAIGLTSLPVDPFTDLLTDADNMAHPCAEHRLRFRLQVAPPSRTPRRPMR